MALVMQGRTVMLYNKQADFRKYEDQYVEEQARNVAAMSGFMYGLQARME